MIQVNNFGVLLLGRVLSGVATSLLGTSFDTWVVSEHQRNGHSSATIGQTLALATAGNGFVAVAAGLCGQAVATNLGKQEVSCGGGGGGGTFRDGGRPVCRGSGFLYGAVWVKSVGDDASEMSGGCGVAITPPLAQLSGVPRRHSLRRGEFLPVRHPPCRELGTAARRRPAGWRWGRCWGRCRAWCRGRRREPDFASGEGGEEGDARAPAAAAHVPAGEGLGGGG